MPDDIIIRQVTPKDATVVLGLIRDLAVYEGLGDKVVSTPELLAETLRARDAAAFVVEHGDEAIGFALYYHIPCAV